MKSSLAWSVLYSPFGIIINKPFSYPRTLIILRLSPYLEFFVALISAELTRPAITKPTLKLCSETETKHKTYSNERLLKCCAILKAQVEKKINPISVRLAGESYGNDRFYKLSQFSYTRIVYLLMFLTI